MGPAAPRPAGQLHNALVDAPCNALSGGNAEVQQAYDPANGYLYEAWIGCGGIGFSRSTDGGYSFDAASAVPGSTTGPTGPTNSSWDPSVVVAPNGTVYVGYMVNRTQGDAPVVAWSFDHGATFAGFQYAFRPALSEFSDRDFLAAAPNGTLFLSWDYSPNASIDTIGCAPAGSCYFLTGDYNAVVVHSSDHGANWSDPVPVDPQYPNGACPAAPLLVEPNGTVDILYENYTVGPGHALGVGRNEFSRSTDGGATWSAPVAVENGTFSNTSWWIDGDLARDRSGTLYATFDTQNGPWDNAGVAVSRDDGRSWSATRTLNPDNDSAAHIEVGVSGGENGTAYVAWMGNNSSSGWSTFESVLSGNGSSLGAPTEVSDGYGLDGYWVGDTIGVTYLGRGTVAVSWSYALPPAPSAKVEIYAAVLGENLPGPPTISRVVPGAGNATVTWTAPVSGGPAAAYTVTWGVEGRHTFFQNVSGATRTTLLPQVQAFVRYQIEVAAANTAGIGPFSAPVNLTLTAWSLLSGSVVPSAARVTLDGIPVAVIAGTFSVNSTPGIHELAATAPTVTPQAIAVSLPWNGSFRVNLTLPLLPGVVAGRISPTTATVTWDGSLIPLGPGGSYTESGPAGSNHSLRAVAPGYVARAVAVTIASNATTWVNLSLAPVNGTLQLYVTPATAQVWVNDTPVVLSADGRANLSKAPGLYRITASAPGYEPFVENVTVSGGSLPIAVTLTPNPPAATGPSGSTVPLGVWVAGLGILLAVVVVALVGLRRPRSPPPAAEAEPLYGSAAHGTDGAPSDDGTPHPVEGFDGPT